jgi:hypothetical protein
MTVTNSFLGAGFTKPESAWPLLKFSLTAFPMLTFAMSGYDGTLIALLCFTVFLAIEAADNGRIFDASDKQA